MSRKSFINLMLTIRSNNRSTVQEQHSEKYSFHILISDAKTEQDEVVCKFSDSSAVDCRKSVGVCPDIDTFTNCVKFASDSRNSPSKLIEKPLKFGPEYSSDVSGDGPNRENGDSKTTDESTSSDSRSDSSDNRPPTPPKPRGMSKRNYKKLVRKHRKKYPKRKLKDLRNDVQKCQNFSQDS